MFKKILKYRQAENLIERLRDTKGIPLRRNTELRERKWQRKMKDSFMKGMVDNFNSRLCCCVGGRTHWQAPKSL